MLDSETAPSSNIDVLADANDQLHWGDVVETVRAAACKLRARNLNPSLAELLEGKIARWEFDEVQRRPTRNVSNG